ncbi:MAG: DUF2971 domain-containing protein [Pseudomonadota bacterium]
MRVYHLLSSNYGLDDIAKRRLKIARISDLNDPFELLAAELSDKLHRDLWRRWRNAQETRWGMLCFSKTWSNPVLWSHYGERHRGIALGFDVDDEYLIKVAYTKKRHKIDVFALEQDGRLSEDLMLKFMQTKFEDWRYEKEVRVFANLDNKDVDTGLHFFAFDDIVKLKEVVVGPLSDVTEDDVREHLKPEDQGVRVIKARLAFNSFKVVENQAGFKYAKT